VRHSAAQSALEILGKRLREIREEAGLSGLALGGIVGWHSSKVSRIEHGRQGPSVDDVRVWCRACKSIDQEADLLASLRAVEGMWTEWRRMERGGLRAAQESVVDLYRRTMRLHVYSSSFIPGLLQTKEYTTLVLRAIGRRRGLPEAPGDIQASVDVRMARQSILRDAERRFSFLIEEAVLRSGVGGPDVMTAQLGHLLTCTSLPTVHLGILPLHSGRDNSWMVEEFWIFDEKLVTVELVSGYLQVTQPYDVTLYAKAFADLTRNAVFGSEAHAFIAEVIRDLNDAGPTGRSRS
jgi:transcriptional regulator with XRE-family HTH domain